MFVDSHCHLDRLSEHTHGGDVAATLDAARAANVSQFLAISTTLEELPGLAAIARAHHDVAISAGLHPLHQEPNEPTVDDIVEAAEQYGVVAIGETGLDYHYQESVPVSVQHERFKRHLIAANELELPVIIHTREAKEDTLALLREYSNPQVGGVIHCFTEDLDMAREAVRLGFYISLSGIITFRNAASLRTLARQLPLDRLLIETDSLIWPLSLIAVSPMSLPGSLKSRSVLRVNEASAWMKLPCKRPLIFTICSALRHQTRLPCQRGLGTVWACGVTRGDNHWRSVMNIDRLLQQSEGSASIPPVDTWQPALSGEMDILIQEDGSWLHEGQPFARPAIAKLLSSLLRLDADGYCLVTPVERWRIAVVDRPFVVVEADFHDGAWWLKTQFDDVVRLDAEHPMRLTASPSGEMRPNVLSGSV